MRLGWLCGTILLAMQAGPAFAGDYRELNSQGIMSLRQGDYLQAEAQFKQALLEYEPEKTRYDNTIKTNLAVLYRKMGKNDLAASLEARVAAEEGKTTAAGSAPLSNKDYISFAQQSLNRIVGAHVKHPVEVMTSSSSAMKRPNGDVTVTFTGSAGDRLVAVEIVVARSFSGDLSIASSKCDAYYSTFAAPQTRGKKDNREDDDESKPRSILSNPEFSSQTPPEELSSSPNTGDFGGPGEEETSYSPPAPPPSSGG